MGCLPSVPVTVKFGKAAPAAVVDPDPDLAMRSLEKVIPASMAVTGGGSAKSIASKLFPTEIERQSFLNSAYMALQGNDDFKIRSYSIILSFPRAEGGKGYYSALRAVDKDQKVIKSICSEQYGETHQIAFTALVDTVERLARKMLSHPDICVAARKPLRSNTEEAKRAKKAHIVKSPFLPAPPRRVHPNVTLIRDDVVHNPRPRDVNKRQTQGTFYTSGEAPSGRYPDGQFPTVQRGSSADVFLQSAKFDEHGNRKLTTAGAHGGLRPTVERHSSIDPLLQPADGYRSSMQSKTSAAENHMSSRSMHNIQERALSLMEEIDLRRSCSYGNMLQTARRSFPVSGHHTLYYDKDSNGPPIIRRPGPRDPNVITFQGSRKPLDRIYMTGFSPHASTSGYALTKRPEMAQRRSQSGLQRAIRTGAQPDHHHQYPAHRSRIDVPAAVEVPHQSLYPYATTASITRNSIASTHSEYYPGETTVASSNACLPRYHHRDTSRVSGRRPAILPQSQHHHRTEAIVGRASMISSQSGAPQDTRVMVTGSAITRPASNQETEFLLSASPRPVTPLEPRYVRDPSPVKSEFGGMKPLRCTRKVADPHGRPIARIESMSSSAPHGTTSLVSGESTKPLVRLPPVDDCRPIGYEATG